MATETSLPIEKLICGHKAPDAPPCSTVLTTDGHCYSCHPMPHPLHHCDIPYWHWEGESPPPGHHAVPARPCRHCGEALAPNRVSHCSPACLLDEAVAAFVRAMEDLAEALGQEDEL